MDRVSSEVGITVIQITAPKLSTSPVPPNAGSEKLSCSEQDAALLTALIHGSGMRLGRLERWSALTARGSKRAERLLYLRKQAIHAETQGKQTAADFFWTEAHHELAWLSRHPATWRSFVEAVPTCRDAPGRGDTDALFRQFVREAFVDTHLSWYEAWQSKVNLRAYQHLEYARRLVDLASLSYQERWQRIGPRTVAEIRYREHQQEWRVALRRAVDLVNLFPEVTAYVNLLCEVRVDAALAQLRRRGKAASRRQDERTLALVVYELKKLRIDRPHHFAIFNAIARLQMVQAEIMATSGLLAEALVEAESALTYSPDIAGGVELRTQLETAMQQLRVQSADPNAEQAAVRGREASVRRQQAAKGFRLVDAFRRSDEARAVSEDLPVAHGRVIWENIGLGPLETIDHRPLALDDAIQTILHVPPADAGDLPMCWERVSQDNPHLRELDSGRICAYLSNRLFGTAFAAAPTDVFPSEIAPAALQVDTPVRSSEPFFPWLFSRRNRWVKLQMVMASVLAVVAIVTGLSEFQARAVRAEAYQALRQARNEASYESMLDAAETFLSQRIIGRDDRIAEVEALYSEALVRWFNEAGPAPEQAERRLSQYRRLLFVRPETVR
jgi:hypothetical protein